MASGGTDPRVKSDDVVEAHNRIARVHGEVFFGKLGKPPGAGTIALIKECVDGARQPQLIISRRNEDDFEFFGAPIKDIRRGGGQPVASLVPEYYREAAPFMSLWVKIGCFVALPERRVGKMVLLSNKRPLSEMVRICARTPLMVITE
jgi:hypothetical protein